MYCEVIESEDTTTLYLRWEIKLEMGELKRLKALGGPLVLAIDAENYVDVSGAFHESAEVEVPIYPHPGRRNLGQAKFTDYESRRHFWETLQEAIITDVVDFVFDAAPGSVDVEGHVIRVGSPA